jgi:hypothetical protein
MRINTINMQKPFFAPVPKIGLLLLALLFGMSSCEQSSDSNTSPIEETPLLDSVAMMLEEVDERFDTLSGNWVNDLYLAEIKKTGSAFMSQHRMLPITEIIFDEDKRVASLHYGYQESCSGKLLRQGNKLEIVGCGEADSAAFRFEYDPFEKKLLYVVDELTFTFVRLSDAPEPPGQAVQRDYLLQSLQGIWQSASALKPFGGKLQFDGRGFVKGISAYNKFQFVLNYDEDPAFMDLVLLYRGANSYDAWYWQLDVDSLRFYSYIPEAPDMFEEVGVYYRLP